MIIHAGIKDGTGKKDDRRISAVKTNIPRISEADMERGRIGKEYTEGGFTGLVLNAANLWKRGISGIRDENIGEKRKKSIRKCVDVQ